MATQRETRQKRALATLLDETESFRSAQDLHGDLKQRGHTVGLTTVYNQLRALAEADEVDTLRTAEGEVLYRRCGSGHHHHHLVCRMCGATVEVEGPEVEKWAVRVAGRHGFVDIAHTIEIVGTCADCHATQPATQPATPPAGR